MFAVLYAVQIWLCLVIILENAVSAYGTFCACLMPLSSMYCECYGIKAYIEINKEETCPIVGHDIQTDAATVKTLSHAAFLL
jgi:hypothetical protein